MQAQTALAGPAVTVEPLLKRYREMTLQALLDGLPRRGPAYLYDLLPTYPSRPGKGLRAGLCLAACAAFGGDTRRALNTAAAIELFHNAFLIHDDIQDASTRRRGDLTLQSMVGPSIALNVGNAMNLLALQRIRANRALLGAHVSWQIFEETETMLRHSLEGQAIELGWIRDNATGLGADDYYRMCLKKTSWYTCLYPCRVGLLISGGAQQVSSTLDRYGWYLGAAFQIQDDLLNLTGSYEEYGKEILGDLYEGKRTLMLIHLQSTLVGADARRLEKFLGCQRHERSETDVRWVRDSMEAHGSLTAARTAAIELAVAARAEADLAVASEPESADKDLIRSLPDYVVARTR
jgi:geranylgeranyl diphosphate synthase type II